MFKEATDLIEDRLTTLWSTTPIDGDNVEYNPIRGTAFVRLQIEWTDTTNVSVGGRVVGEGYVDLSLFIPTNTGTSTLNGLADDLAAIYNKWDTGALRFLSATTQRIGEQDQWYQLKVIIPFSYQECKPV